MCGSWLLSRDSYQGAPPNRRLLQTNQRLGDRNSAVTFRYGGANHALRHMSLKRNRFSAGVSYVTQPQPQTNLCMSRDFRAN